MDQEFAFDRRTLIGSAAAGAALMSSSAALAQAGDRTALMRAIEAGHGAAVKRIQDWIANPTIAAEGRNVVAALVIEGESEHRGDL